MKDADEESSPFDPFWEYVLDDYDDPKRRMSSSRQDSSSSSESTWYDSWNESWFNDSSKGKRKVKFQDRVQVEWRLVKEGREPISKERRQHSWTDLSNKPYTLKRSFSETLGRRPDTRWNTMGNGRSLSYDDIGISRDTRSDTWMRRSKWKNQNDRDQPPNDNKILASRKLLGKLICKRIPSFGRRRQSGSSYGDGELLPSFTF